MMYNYLEKVMNFGNHIKHRLGIITSLLQKVRMTGFLLKENVICLKSFLTKSMEHNLHRLKVGFILLTEILMLVTILITPIFLLFAVLILGTGCLLWDGSKRIGSMENGI